MMYSTFYSIKSCKSCCKDSHPATSTCRRRAISIQKHGDILIMSSANHHRDDLKDAKRLSQIIFKKGHQYFTHYSGLSFCDQLEDENESDDIGETRHFTRIEMRHFRSLLLGSLILSFACCPGHTTPDRCTVALGVSSDHRVYALDCHCGHAPYWTDGQPLSPGCDCCSDLNNYKHLFSPPTSASRPRSNKVITNDILRNATSKHANNHYRIGEAKKPGPPKKNKKGARSTRNTRPTNPDKDVIEDCGIAQSRRCQTVGGCMVHRRWWQGCIEQRTRGGHIIGSPPWSSIPIIEQINEYEQFITDDVNSWNSLHEGGAVQAAPCQSAPANQHPTDQQGGHIVDLAAGAHSHQTQANNDNTFPQLIPPPHNAINVSNDAEQISTALQQNSVANEANIAEATAWLDFCLQPQSTNYESPSKPARKAYRQSLPE